MNNDTGVYVITSPSGKRYIGSAISFKKRWAEHLRLLRLNKHHSPSLQNAYNKYGEPALVFSRVALCLATELRLIEQRYIDKLSPEYNIAKLADAPPLARDFSAATRAKMSASHIGIKQAPELVKKRIAARMGYAHSNQTRMKIGAANAGRKATPEQIEANRRARKVRGEKHHQYGKPISDEHKAALSKAHRGKTVPEDVRLRTSETMKGMNVGAANPMARAVICLTTGAEFPTCSAAVAWLRESGKSKAIVGAISASCRNPKRTAYGHRWAYADVIEKAA